MYQYNILNACLACLELQEVIDKTLSGLLTSRHNVDDIKAEARQIILNDDILPKYDKPLWITLKRILDIKLGKKKSDDESTDNDNFRISLQRLKYQLTNPCNLLKRNYKSYLIQELREDIAQQNCSKMEIHMSALISQCLYEGWSTTGLFNLSNYLHGDGTADDKINVLFERILSTDTIDFIVYHSINIETRRGLNSEAVRQTIISLGIDLKKGSEIIEAESIEDAVRNLLYSEKHYAIISVNAYDLHSAVLYAINTIQRKLSIATFYNIISPFIANTPTIVAFDTSTNTAIPLKLTDVFRTYDHVDSSNNVFEDTKNLFNNSDNNLSTIVRLSAAFSYTNLSRTSYFQETKFISLWIALESIMRTGQYSDIISHIKQPLPPALCVRYFYKIIRNFAEDCIRCRVKYLTAPIELDLQDENKKQVVTRLISIFRDSAEYQLLLQRCEVNNLLHYRCEQIHDIITDSTEMKNKLEHYKTKIEWHIQRLYRIRNEITHSAFKNDRSLVIYIEHLYFYLSQLISEIVFYFEHKEATSIEDVYATLENNYLTLIELLGNNTMAITDILPDGVINVI